MFERRRMQAGLHRLDDGLRRERDDLPFTRASGATLHKLIIALRAGNMLVRRYEKAFLHAKAYIFSPSDGAYGKPEGINVGSSNLTGAGLTRNLELNLGRYERPIVEQARKWFDDLWEEAKPYDLAIVFEEAFRPRTPWEIFIRVLWQLYGDEVEEDAKADQNLPLTSFQKHGVARALRLIRDSGGAIVADEVGLGKTFIAGEVLQIYHERRQRALLICPAALRDSTWKKFLTRFQLFVECLSFEELANDRQLQDAQRPHADQEKLQRSLDEYQLVVVDEAHNYRNPDAPTRAAALRRLLFGRRRDLLLLTATPVNNSLWDLYHLIRFFMRQDAHLANRGILSIRERFDRAMHEDPSSLSPDVLYPIIDATTVKRTRQFVKKHYAGDTIVGPDARTTGCSCGRSFRSIASTNSSTWNSASSTSWRWRRPASASLRQSRGRRMARKCSRKRATRSRSCWRRTRLSTNAAEPPARHRPARNIGRRYARRLSGIGSALRACPGRWAPA